MTTSSAQDLPGRGPLPPCPPAPLTWRAHPWKQEPRLRTAALIAIIAAVAVTAAWSFEHLLYGAGSALLLLASTSRYLLPTDYAVDADGARATHLGRTTRLTWDRVARVDVQRDGLFLSPFRRPSRLDSYRGLFLRCGADVAPLRDAVEHWRRLAPGCHAGL